MSTTRKVVGVRDMDGLYAKMMAIKLACDAVDSDYPESVVRYFGEYAEYSETDLMDRMETVDITNAVSVVPADGRDVVEVDLARLPSEVARVRFVISY